MSIAQNDLLYFTFLFPNDFTDIQKENAIYIQSFIFDDANKDPKVERSNGVFNNQPSLHYTIYDNMRFEENSLTPGSWTADKPLTYDSYTSAANQSVYLYTQETAVNRTIKQWSSSANVLNSTGPNGIFRVVAQSNFDVSPTEDKFMFYDNRNTFLVRRIWENVRFSDAVVKPNEVNLSISGTMSNTLYNPNAAAPWVNPTSQVSVSFAGTTVMAEPVLQTKYFFQTFYHNHAGDFIKAFNRLGIDGLLTLPMQDQTNTMNFIGNYAPTNLVHPQHPGNEVDFDYNGAYSIYNWELFYHIPMLIAQRLSDNQQFEAAQKWYHYIFDPTCSTGLDGTTPSSNKNRFWNFWPFYNRASQPTQTLNDLLILISNRNKEAIAQVHKWEENPFKPHAIARLRILAYMKSTVMKYLDNLIAWGDQLFRRDTIESINEASNIYLLAANILGPRPNDVPRRTVSDPKSFNDLALSGLDALSNAKVIIESYIDPSAGYTFGGKINGAGMTMMPRMFYFCLSNNEKLTQYWDTVEDRFFKIRNCMNIDGQVRQLPLFEPPIDPALLVRAAAAGIDLGAFSGSTANKSLYRFNYVVQKANELCGEVKALGNTLLSILEKKDAEQLALLRSGQEIALLEQIRLVKRSQIEEAQANLESLERTKENVEKRIEYYGSRPFMNAKERESIMNLEAATILQAVSGGMSSLASALGAIPQAHAQAVASGVSFGGLHLGNLMQGISQALGVAAAIKNSKGSMAATIGGYERRMDDWKFQADTGRKELEQVNKQILAAEIRLNIAERELDNQDLQIENSKTTDEYMRSKFTNRELYNWMLSQIAATYFQAYQLAFDLAQKAELCYKNELPLSKSSEKGFVKFGYWDSLKKGLLAGEKLQYDIRRMELAYMEDNKREFEMTKQISLVLTDAEELLKLRTTGSCTIDIPETLYNMDYAGHYLRRIKSVSISIPCIAAPYTTISCKLTQTTNKYRKSASLTGGYNESNTPPDSRFVYGTSSDAIATSSSQNDNGVFELNFRDERYLPFEGTGAISTWQLSFPGAVRQFDYNTISDVILHIKYTAKEDTNLAGPATTALTTIMTNTGVEMPRYFSLKREFANEWYAFAEAVLNNDPNAKLNIQLKASHFPFFTSGKNMQVRGMFMQSRLKPTIATSPAYVLDVKDTPNNFKATLSNNTGANVITPITGTQVPLSLGPINQTTNLQLALDIKKSGVNVNLETVLDDLYLVVYYKFL